MIGEIPRNQREDPANNTGVPYTHSEFSCVGRLVAGLLIVALDTAHGVLFLLTELLSFKGYFGQV